MTFRNGGWSSLLVLALTAYIALAWVMSATLQIFVEETWLFSLVGLVVLTFALWRTRRWLLLLCLPVLGAPVGLVSLLIMAYFNGDSL